MVVCFSLSVCACPRICACVVIYLCAWANGWVADNGSNVVGDMCVIGWVNDGGNLIGWQTMAVVGPVMMVDVVLILVQSEGGDL